MISYMTKSVNIIHDIIYCICDITNPRGKFYWKSVDNGMRSMILALNPPVLDCNIKYWMHLRPGLANLWPEIIYDIIYDLYDVIFLL